MEDDQLVSKRLYEAATCLHRRRIRRIPLWCSERQLETFKQEYAEELAKLWEARVKETDSLKVIGCFAELADSLEIETCHKLEKVAFLCIKKLFAKTSIYHNQNPCVIDIYKTLCLLCDHVVMKHRWDLVLFENYQTVFMDQCEWFCSYELLHRNLPYATKFMHHVISRCRKQSLSLIPLPSFALTMFSWVTGWPQLLDIIVEGFNRMSKSALLQHMPTADPIHEFIEDLNRLKRYQWTLNFSNVLAMEILTIWCIKTNNSLEAEMDKLKHVNILALFDHYCLMSSQHGVIRPWASMFFMSCLSFKNYCKDVMTILLEITKNVSWCRRLNIYYDLSYRHLLSPHHVDVFVNSVHGPAELQKAGDNIHQILQERGVHVHQLEHILKPWMSGKLYSHLQQKPSVDLSRFLTCNRTVAMPTECAICSSDENSMVILAPCGHVFCVGCYPLENAPCHVCKTSVRCVVRQVYG